MTAHIVNTHEAKSRLSELIREVEEGRDVIVARNGRPVAKIISWPPAHVARTPGVWTGRVEYHEDPVDSDEEVASMFDESAAAELP